MGYSVKWIFENLGITRDMLRYYEKKGVLSAEKSRTSVGNHEYKRVSYSDEDIEKIWAIKLLIGIGFSVEEILKLMDDPNFDFDTTMAQKIAELERKHDENLINLEFAKSIKLMGRIPTASKIGNIRFDDFLAYVHKNWNFYNDPEIASFAKLTDALARNETHEWETDTIERILENIDAERMVYECTLQGYYQVIADMQELGHASDIVQRVVRLLHKYMVDYNMEPEWDGKITPQFIAKYTAASFLNGNLAVLRERNYGKEGCLFIAQALAHYGGYDIDDL